MNSDKKVVLCVRLEEDDRLLLEIVCREEYRNVSQCLRHVIKKYIEKKVR
ncbi:MAG: hypothetical protein QXV81_08110 [Ignisphaera sp.]